MIPKRILENASLKELYWFMLDNRLSRRVLFSVIRRRLFKELVEVNVDNRPRRVQELKHAYFMALLHGFDRALERGYISKHVTGRLLDTVLDGIIVNESKRDASFGHGPLLLVVSPTGRCNLKCRGCYSESGSKHQNSLTFEVFDRIVREKTELWDSHLNVVSGGEPFMWRDGARGLLELAEQHPGDFFMVYTNGTLITDELAERMGELGTVSPAISLEGFERETDERRGRGVYKKILTAFENLRKHGVPFGVSVTPTRENWDVITSDEFIDFCFEQQGAVYCWSFQYMPIGSRPEPNLMLTPEQRFELLRRTHHLIYDKKVLFADFWNSGIASYGCISAGRADGHFHIDWNGDITPCVFVPYAVDNIYSIYERGGNLDTVQEAPFFKKIQAWQNDYGFRQEAEHVQNWLCPCPMRDHFNTLRRAAIDTGARPINEAAAGALSDPEYRQAMEASARRYRELSASTWEDQFADLPAPKK